METYIALMNITQQGITNLKEDPERSEGFREAVEALGGKLTGWYLTIGRYDIVAVIQVPDAKVIAKLVLAAGVGGNVRTETLRAFTLDEAKEIVAGMP